MKNKESLYELLEEKYRFYQNPEFIETDPISVPHCFSLKEDIEISALLSATIAWGKRSMIIKNAQKMMQLMDYAPFDFIMNAVDKDLKPLLSFKHRTFQADDLLFFIEGLRFIYRQKGGLEAVFCGEEFDGSVSNSILRFRDSMFLVPHQQRTAKHISNPAKGSAAKRLNMFLRWMVRSNEGGVDFGLWKSIPPSALLCPLDVHSGRVARHFGLLLRKQDDWKAVEELTANLRVFDAEDPVKYDFSLFGMGVFEKAGLGKNV